MSMELAQRLSEALLGWALLQASAEHLVTHVRLRALYGLRALAGLALIAGVAPALALWLAWIATAFHLRLHHGPYNGGADKMAVLILTCLGLARILPDAWVELALSYLAAQLILSYFVSGWIKVIKGEWRRGEALVDVFRYSAYPVSERLRLWSDRPRALWAMGWAVMGLELVFPLTLLWAPALWVALALTASFHLANACLFGLNRFFWIWISAYPVLLWFQGRVLG